jgi:hypothetical protein
MSNVLSFLAADVPRARLFDALRTLDVDFQDGEEVATFHEMEMEVSTWHMDGDEVLGPCEVNGQTFAWGDMSQLILSADAALELSEEIGARVVCASAHPVAKTHYLCVANSGALERLLYTVGGGETISEGAPLSSEAETPLTREMVGVLKAAKALGLDANAAAEEGPFMLLALDPTTLPCDREWDAKLAALDR